MARKPILSPTRISTYLACPVKYRWTYVDPNGKWYVRNRSYYSFGQTLHRVLERFHDAEDHGVETKEELVAAYDESWLSGGFSSAEEMAEAYGDGKEILLRHVEAVTSRPKAGRTLFVEKQLTLEFTEFRLLGRIDRIDEHEDGTLEIVDYKSGRASVTPKDVAEDLAMNIYQLLLQRAYPNRRILATIHALRSETQASACLDQDELATLERDLEAIGNQIVSRDYFEIVPVPKPLCASCDFVSLCRRSTAFASAPIRLHAFDE